ncbi:MAG: hypothetical protein RBU45_22335 [Myxococcota bacterium]|jgi:hypothetical protein|nr:hypothetical protein [Myxococcota bacterium]
MSHRDDIAAALQAEGTPFRADGSGRSATDRTLWLSADLVRCPAREGMPTVFVADGFKFCWDAVVDAVHWVIHDGLFGDGVRIAVAYDLAMADATDRDAAAASRTVREAMATLAAAVNQPQVELATYTLQGGQLTVMPASWPLPSFGPLSAWAAMYRSRGSASLPLIGQRLLTALGSSVPSFRWYRSLSSSRWSGRVAGWEFCRLDRSGQAIEFRDYRGRQHLAIQSFRNSPADLSALAHILDDVALRRANPRDELGSTKLEHLLESGAWRSAIPVQPRLPALGRPLLSPVVAPSDPPFQMPARYGALDDRRSIDVVMQDGRGVPWVVEIKVSSGSQGQYYRHAIAQALLYREFVRTASSLHSPLTTIGIIHPADCQAAIAFPELEGGFAVAQGIRSRLLDTAGLFGVGVAELDPWSSLHQACMV